MNAEDLTVIRSPAACQIKADCHDLASEVGVPLESVSWMRGLPHTNTPFHLKITVSGINAIREVEFTQDQILGYPTGHTTTEVQEKIRAALESILPDLEEN